jgi:hypothetical protein
MPFVDKEKEKQYKKEHYLKNKDKYKTSAKKHTKHNKRKLKQYISNLKETTPCKDCNKFYIAIVMDFDHRLGEIKKFNVAYMVGKHKNREDIEAEIAKCDIVCSNCHRIRTFNRLNEGKVAERSMAPHC